jgi:hypothetical protein
MVYYECIYSYFMGIDADAMYLAGMGTPNSFGENSIINAARSRNSTSDNYPSLQDKREKRDRFSNSAPKFLYSRCNAKGFFGSAAIGCTIGIAYLFPVERVIQCINE